MIVAWVSLVGSEKGERSVWVCGILKVVPTGLAVGVHVEGDGKKQIKDGFPGFLA